MVRRCSVLLFLLGPFVALAQVQPVVPPPPMPPPQLPNPIIDDPTSLIGVFQGASISWMHGVYPYALGLFGALAVLEIGAFAWSLVMTNHGDFRQALMSTTNKILLIGVFFTILLNGQTWPAQIIGMFVTVGKNITGIPNLTPSAVLAQGFNIFGTMGWQAVKTGAFGNVVSGLALLLAAFVICISFLVITFQFVVTEVQSFLALGIGYFFLAFGASRWTTPYVERYFAYCVATGTKLMGLYALIGVGWNITNNWVAQAKQIGLYQSDVEVAFKIMCGALLYAGIVWFASAQISQILGGSPSISHSDFVSFMGPMVSAGVSAAMVGAAVATGPIGAAGAAGAAAARTAASTAASGATAAQPSAAAASGGASGSSTSGLRALGQLARVGANTASRMPGGGPNHPPPHFQGFGH